MDEEIVVYMLIMEYYSDLKEYNIVICDDMYLEDIMLSEINQTEKDEYYMISPLCEI